MGKSLCPLILNRQALAGLFRFLQITRVEILTCRPAGALHAANSDFLLTYRPSGAWHAANPAIYIDTTLVIPRSMKEVRIFFVMQRSV